MDRVEFEPLTDEEMQAQGLTDDKVWMLQHGDEVYGPYETHSLKAHALANVEFYSTLQVSIVSEAKWRPFFEVEAFARRIPKLVPSTTLANPERFWVIHKAQRHGPHSQAEVQALIDDQDLLSTDVVSCDEGASWQKLYTLKYFSLGPSKTGELPGAPDFGASMDASEHLVGADPVKDGLASLAFFGHKKTDTLNLSEVIMPKAQPKEAAPSQKPKITLPVFPHREKVLYGSVAVMMLVGLLTLLPSTDPSVEDEQALAEASSPVDMNDVELVPSGTSLLEESTPTPRPRSRFNRRSPANQAARVPSPRSMNGARRNIARYQESHDDYVDPPEQPEPPENGLYPEDMPEDLAAADAPATPERAPGSQPEANDDGYRMEGPADSTSSVEEVGDF